MLRQSRVLNHRQLAVLSHALAHPDAGYTATAHANSHHVTRQTARTDLKELHKAGLLMAAPLGKGFVYTVPPDLADRLDALGRTEGTPPS